MKAAPKNNYFCCSIVANYLRNSPFFLHETKSKTLGTNVNGMIFNYVYLCVVDKDNYWHSANASAQ